VSAGCSRATWKSADKAKHHGGAPFAVDERRNLTGVQRPDVEAVHSHQDIALSNAAIRSRRARWHEAFHHQRASLRTVHGKRYPHAALVGGRRREVGVLRERLPALFLDCNRRTSTQ
jgi:hypothetical protein